MGGGGKGGAGPGRRISSDAGAPHQGQMLGFDTENLAGVHF